MGALVGVGDAIGVGVLDAIVTGRGVASGNHRSEGFAFDCGRTAMFHSHAPQSDVIMVSAPVRHRPTRLLSLHPSRIRERCPYLPLFLEVAEGTF